jgi:hypothetical protein
MLATLLGFVSGFFTAIFAEPLRIWMFAPRLRLEFVHDDDDFVTKTKEKTSQGTVHDARYVRVRVTNSRPALAKSCRAYLVKIEHQSNSTDEWEASEYSESLQLAWSGRHDQSRYGALDLPQDIPHFVDVLSVRAVSAEFLPGIESKLFRYEELYRRTGTFRFTVAVSGDGVKPAWIRLWFKWSGVWDQCEIVRLT